MSVSMLLNKCVTFFVYVYRVLILKFYLLTILVGISGNFIYTGKLVLIFLLKIIIN